MFTIDSLIGQKVSVKKILDPLQFIYLVSLDGEVWHALSTHPLRERECAFVTHIKGLYVFITPFKK